MIYNIDPKVDCVFKAILGRRSRRHLLLHFLNAMLEDKLRYPLVKVTILNPYSSKDYETDKLHIVDIRAEDSRGRQFQLEIQRKNYTSLPERIVYSWCHLYQEQLEEGMNYDELQPVYSIWLLTESFGHKRLNAAQKAAKTATQTKSQPPPPLRHYAPECQDTLRPPLMRNECRIRGATEEIHDAQRYYRFTLQRGYRPR
ncbi:Rpn family recombination-promoting nuclease/putative transposase [Ectothiorhodospiraceae bacterium BW-2]|nr:Rpn family recombination-promoting nuclease/putative transposase [Ectothiorhodospiraceae bacterium BW-2]